MISLQTFFCFCLSALIIPRASHGFLSSFATKASKTGTGLLTGCDAMIVRRSFRMDANDGFNRISRNKLLSVAISSAAFWVWGTHRESAWGRVKGAAELDLEYYWQSLQKGNPRTGVENGPNINKRTARRLDPSLSDFLLMITVEEVSKVSGVSVPDIQKKIAAFFKDVEPSFQRKNKFPSGDLSNEFYFDASSYATYRIAADLVQNLQTRALMVRKIGERVFEKVLSDMAENAGLGESRPVLKVVDANKDGLSECFVGLAAIGTYFQEKGFIKGYKINDEDYERSIWDEGYKIDLFFSAYEPATLTATLQFTGEDSLFHPDYIGTTLLAYFRKCGVKKAKIFEFFLDDTYRENPKDYDPREILFEFNLERTPPKV